MGGRVQRSSGRQRFQKDQSKSTSREANDTTGENTAQYRNKILHAFRSSGSESRISASFSGAVDADSVASFMSDIGWDRSPLRATVAHPRSGCLHIGGHLHHAAVEESEIEVELLPILQGGNEADQHDVVAAWFEGDRAVRRNSHRGDFLHRHH